MGVGAQDTFLPELDARLPPQIPPQWPAAITPHLHRFTLVFDLEGYSPDWVARLKDQQIAVITNRKYRSGAWPKTEFHEHTLTLPMGGETRVKLAEPGVCLNNRLWVREIRKLTERGHQTALLATDYQSDLTRVAASMFVRWSQENFFKYMCEHYGLDKLAGYSTEDITEPTQVVDPAYRDLDGKVTSLVGKLNRMNTHFGAMHFRRQPG